MTHDFQSENLAAASLKRTHLAELLINNPELEVVADHVLVKCDNEPGRLRTTEQLSVWFLDMCSWWTAGSKRERDIWEKITMRTSAYFRVEDRIKPIHIYFFTNKL